MVGLGGGLKRSSTSRQNLGANVWGNYRKEPGSSEQKVKISPKTAPFRSFVRQLILAFHCADVYAAKQLDLRSRGGHRKQYSHSIMAMRSGFLATPPNTPEALTRSKLKVTHSTCIEGGIETLVQLMGVAAFEDEKEKVRIALDGDLSELAQNISTEAVIEAMNKIESRFAAVVQTQRKEGSNPERCSDYAPDWKTRNMIWCLIRAVVRRFQARGTYSACFSLSAW